MKTKIFVVFFISTVCLIANEDGTNTVPVVKKPKVPGQRPTPSQTITDAQRTVLLQMQQQNLQHSALAFDRV